MLWHTSGGVPQVEDHGLDEWTEAAETSEKYPERNVGKLV
jgi:hypothetical protein